MPEGKRNQHQLAAVFVGAELVVMAQAFTCLASLRRFPLEPFSHMKVLVADKISPKGVAYLRQQPGFEVVEAYGSSPEKVLELVKDVHAIAVRSETKISAEVFKAAPLLKVVGRAGVGVDNVDVEAATQHGVVVMNTPAGNTIATAELTFTHILCGARPVPQAAASMKACACWRTILISRRAGPRRCRSRLRRSMNC
jgi:phosphoglycerate dehydrogenase-like enzyme